MRASPTHARRPPSDQQRSHPMIPGRLGPRVHGCAATSLAYNFSATLTVPLDALDEANIKVRPGLTVKKQPSPLYPRKPTFRFDASTSLRNKAAPRLDDTSPVGRHWCIAPYCDPAWRIRSSRSGGRSSSLWRRRHRRRLWLRLPELPTDSWFLSQRKQWSAPGPPAEYTAQIAWRNLPSSPAVIRSNEQVAHQNPAN